MQNTSTSEAIKSVLIKLLAIIGFLATVAIIIWLVVEGVRRAPGTFASLASIVESLNERRAIEELTIATEKGVVNSAESFQISWTDVKQDGEYTFTYACTQGVTIEVRSADGFLVPVACTDTLTLPSNVHGLFLSVTSDDMRFTDVPLKVAFANTDKSVHMENETKVTVVNATIPVKEEPQVAVAPQPEPEEPKPVPVSSANTGFYPEPAPLPYVDLQVKTLGSGVIEDGTFRYSTVYETGAHNAVRFDIKNIGTASSGTWTFTTELPGGDVYKSEVQEALKPGEHVQFTLGFGMDADEEIVKVMTSIQTTPDTNAANNSSVWYVTVKD